MSLLTILKYPNILLRKTAKPVIKIDRNIRRIIKNMFETMYKNNGIGLSATQVNIHKRIIVIDISENRNQKIVLINPELLNKFGEIKISEGCLSIPGKYGIVSRFKEVTVKSLRYDGKEIFFKAKDLLSVCIQHEMDHLIGKLFIDYISSS